MNYTLDQVNSFAAKLTYRIMQMSGISEENLQKYLKAVVDKQNGIAAADEDLNIPINIFGINFKNIGQAVSTGIIIVVVIIGIVAYKKMRSRR